MTAQMFTVICDYSAQSLEKDAARKINKAKETFLW